jgi:hypothetical protein
MKMKMGRKAPRASMSKSAKGKSPINPTGRNPIKSASPYETCGIGESVTPKGPSLKKAAPADPVTNDDDDTDA